VLLPARSTISCSVLIVLFCVCLFVIVFGKKIIDKVESRAYCPSCPEVKIRYTKQSILEFTQMSESPINTASPEPLPELWSHQKEILIRATDKFALHWSPGVGKSRAAILLYLRAKDNAPTPNAACRGKAIIISPLTVTRNWQGEIEKYLGLPHKILLVAGQSKAKKLATIKEFAESHYNGNLFLLINIESLRSKEYVDLLCQSGAEFIVADESHQFKSPTSLQTKGLFQMVNTLQPKHLYLLTGTPAPGGQIDLYTTFALLGKTKDSFFIWRKRHFIDKNERRRAMNNYWPEYYVSPKSKEYFQKILLECSSVANKDDVLDLPPLLHTNIYCEMSPDQKRHYDTMKEYLFAIDSDGNELNAANVLVRTLRLQQILAGFIGETPIAENPRIKALEDAIEKTNGNIMADGTTGKPEQFVVWSIFKSTYKQIGSLLDSLGITYGLLTGEQTAEERHQYVTDFQAGKVRALIGHPKAGGIGINLTAASYSIHYTKSYSLVDDMQSEARNYRGGSERHKTITRIDIVTAGTIDEDISTALREKKSVQDFILGLKQKAAL